jgi:hypothetical protein
MVRYSLGTLLAFMALVALGLGALANASEVWAEVMVTTAFILLLAALVAAFVADGKARVFALGFAIVGIGYFLLTFSEMAGVRGHLITNRAVLLVYDWKHKEEVANDTVMPRGNANPFVLPTNAPDPFADDDPFGPVIPSSVLDIAHALWTLLFALLGGVFAQVVHRASCKNEVAA